MTNEELQHRIHELVICAMAVGQSAGSRDIEKGKDDGSVGVWNDMYQLFRDLDNER
jgi:hypothetical protein